MKKLFLLISIFIAYRLSYSQSYGSNDEALFARAKGTGVLKSDLPTQSYLWSGGMDFTCWDGDLSCPHSYAIGSQNHPVIAEEGYGNYQWIAALCRYEKLHGFFGRELGAPSYYFANVIGAKLVALRDARAAGAYSDATDIAEDLRCVWAYESLMAIPTPRKTSAINIAGTITNNTGDQSWYNGLTCSASGDRWHTEDNIAHDTHGEYLSWAIDWQPRSNSSGNLLQGGGYWWGNITAQLGGNGNYSQTIDPEIFGLTASERIKLQQVVNGDVSAAQWAASVVANYGVWKDSNVPVANCYVKLRIRRTSLGAETVYFNSTNGNKPTQAAAQIFNNGDYNSIRPGFYHGTGANNGYSCWIANGLIQADCPGDGAYVSLPEMGGTILWEVDIDGSSVTFNGNAVSPAGQANYGAGLDVGVTNIISPTASVTNDSIFPKVTIKNYSSTTVNVVYISFQIDNGPSWVTTWRGSFAANATMNLNLKAIPVSIGTHTFKVYTGGPNYKSDSNTSNDSQSINFTVTSTSTQTLDAGINSILNPATTVTTDTLKPVATLKNFGQTTLTNVSIRYKIDNGNAVILPWSGSLNTGGTANVSLPFSAISPGAHALQIFTLNPNSQTDGNPANDSQTINFAVVSPYLTDVMAVSVAEPFNLGCATSILPLLVIENEGPVELTQISVDYQVDTNPVVSRTYSVSSGNGLKVGKAMGLYGNTSTTTTGTHNLKIWISTPNNVGDTDNSNDTLNTTFTVGTNGLSLPFAEDFENINSGEIPSNWTRYNWDAFDEWFVYAMPNNKAMAFNNYAYTGAQNTTDDLTLPILDLTGNTSAWLTFDLSHASRPNTITHDSLEVLISTDCGQTFNSLWSRGGTALNTVPDDSNIFIPSTMQDYQNVQIDLSAYTSSNNAILRFRNWSNDGNSTLIDNVNVASSITGITNNNSSLSINLFPVPAKNILNVEYSLRQNSEVKCRILNALGQIIYSENLGMHATGTYLNKVDVSVFPAGVYQVVLSDNTIISQNKIVVIK